MSIHVQDGFDLRYRKGRPESGELSVDEDHYNTGMRDTLTCNNGSNGLFLGDLPSVLEILKQRYLNITIKDTMQKIYHMFSHASQPVCLSVS